MVFKAEAYISSKPCDVCVYVPHGLWNTPKISLIISQGMRFSDYESD